MIITNGRITAISFIEGVYSVTVEYLRYVPELSESVAQSDVFLFANSQKDNRYPIADRFSKAGFKKGSILSFIYVERENGNYVLSFMHRGKISYSTTFIDKDTQDTILRKECLFVGAIGSVNTFDFTNRCTKISFPVHHSNGTQWYTLNAWNSDVKKLADKAQSELSAGDICAFITSEVSERAYSSKNGEAKISLECNIKLLEIIRKRTVKGEGEQG